MCELCANQVTEALDAMERGGEFDGLEGEPLAMAKLTMGSRLRGDIVCPAPIETSMLVELVVPTNVNLPRPVEALAARIVRRDDDGWRSCVKDRSPGSQSAVTIHLHRRLTLDEWRELRNAVDAGVQLADQAVTQLNGLRDTALDLAAD